MATKKWRARMDGERRQKYLDCLKSFKNFLEIFWLEVLDSVHYMLGKWTMKLEFNRQDQGFTFWWSVDCRVK
jgi:hypothetical protein